MLTMRPLCCGSMRRTAARETRNTLVRSQAMTWFQSSSVSSQVSFEPPVIPALLTTMSSRPQRPWAATTARSTSSPRVTSATSAMAEAPSSPAAASTADLSRSTSATRAPSATSRRAMASPIPRAPPVTSATRPLKLIALPSRQRLLEVFDQVVRVLETDRQPQEIVRRARAGALDRGAVLDETLRPAEAGGAREHAELGRHVRRARPVAAHLHRHHSAERGHLAARDVVRRVGREAGIVHRFDLAVAVQERGDPERVLRVAAHSIRQGPDPAA